APNSNQAAGIYIHLGNALHRQEKMPEAIFAFYRALELDPKKMTGAYYNLAIVLKDWGKTDEAIDMYRKGIDLYPNSSQALNNLAWILATRQEANLRDPKEAVSLAERGGPLEPQKGTNWDTPRRRPISGGRLEGRDRRLGEVDGAAQGRRQQRLVLPGDGLLAARREG